MDMVKEEHEELSESEKDDASPAAEFEIGESVKIKKIAIESKQEMEPEDYFYLKGFENKTGTISEQTKNSSGIYSYRVEFDHNKFGYFYGDDLILLH